MSYWLSSTTWSTWSSSGIWVCFHCHLPHLPTHWRRSLTVQDLQTFITNLIFFVGSICFRQLSTLLYSGLIKMNRTFNLMHASSAKQARGCSMLNVHVMTSANVQVEQGTSRKSTSWDRTLAKCSSFNLALFLMRMWFHPRQAKWI